MLSFEDRRKKLLNGDTASSGNSSGNNSGNTTDFTARRNKLMQQETQQTTPAKSSNTNNLNFSSAVNTLKTVAQNAISTISTALQGRKQPSPVSPATTKAITQLKTPGAIQPIQPTKPAPLKLLNTQQDITSQASAQFSSPLVKAPNLIDNAITGIQKIPQVENTFTNIQQWLQQPQNLEVTKALAVAQKISAPYSKGFFSVAAGGSQKLTNMFNQAVPQTNNKFLNAYNTVGEAVGATFAYLSGGEVLKGLQLGKATLPTLFGIIGQTSSPADTTIQQRLEKLPVDVVAGWLLSKVPAAKKLLSAEALKKAGVSVSILSGNTFVDSVIQGLSPKDAAIATGKMAIIAGLFHIGGTATGLIKNNVLSSKYRAGTVTMTPEEIRTQAQGTNLNGTPAADVLNRAADAAEAQGKDIQVNLQAAKKSPVAGLFHANTPNGVAFSLDLVDKQGIQLLSDTSKPSNEQAQNGPITSPVPGAPPETLPQVIKQEVTKPVSGTEPVPSVPPVTTTPAPEIVQPAAFRTPTEQKAYQQIKSETTAKIVDSYIAKNKNELDPDKVRTAFTDYKGYNVTDFNRPTGQLKDAIYTKMLTDNKGQGNNTVLITAGGSGSGKTSAVTEALPQAKSAYPVILDSTFSYNSAPKDVKAALDHGYKVEIAYTLRDPVQAWKKGVLPRVKTEGRIVSEGYFLTTHDKARAQVLAEYQKYKDNPNVEFSIIDNREGQKKLVSIDTLKNFSYNQAEVAKQVTAATEKAYEQKKLTKEEYTATTADRTQPGRQNVAHGSEKTPDKEKVNPPQKKTSSPKGNASVGDYAHLENQTFANNKLTTLEFPEIVNIVKELIGKVPSVRPLRSRLGGMTAGIFQGSEKGITLNPEIFKDPEMAAKILSHELGHLFDYLPEKTMARGNLLGRIASLNKYMKTFLAEYPGAEGELTGKDRARIHRRAETLANKTKQVVTKEIVTGTEPAKPEEILAIWQSNTGGIDNPELLSYISNLSQERKVEIVKAAMRNNIPEWVSFVHEVKKTITEEVLKNSPADIRKLYQQMLKEEIIARRLVDLNVIKKELQQLSYKWRPFNPNLAPAGYLAYRNASTELYADAISVLFNDPVMLKSDAPEFWKAFFNYLDTKPEVKETLFATWDLLNKGEEAVFQERQKNVEKMFDTAEQQFTSKELEKQKVKTNLAYTLKLLFNNRNEPVIRKVNQARKEGKIFDASQNPVFALESLNYYDGKIENFVEQHFQPVYKKAQEITGDGWKKLGAVLLYERAINERGEMANPLGFNPKTAQDQLQGLEKSMSATDWQKLQDAVKLFRSASESIVKRAEETGFYSPELIAQMKANPAYATFQVLDYLDTYISAHVYKAVGTLKEIANPATSSVIKGISVIKAIERNNAKRSAIDFFKKEFPKEIEEAKSVFSGKGRRFVESKDRTKGMVTVVEDGKLQAYYIDKDIAATLNGLSNDTITMAAKISRLLTGSPIYRPLFTSLNLGFSTFNFIRDFQRYWSNIPDKSLQEAITSLPRAVYRYAQATPSALRRSRHVPDRIISEMKDAGILGATYNDIYGQSEVDPAEQQIERIMRRVGLLEKTEKHKIFAPIFKLLDGIEAFNNFIEVLPKIAGYNELKGKMTPQEMADFVRTKVGSPNFRVRGTVTPITNSVLLFSNAIKEGIKSDYQIATGKAGKQSAAGFWWKTILAAFLPTLLIFAGAQGLFGKWYKDRLADISEYDKTNYTVVPMGVDKNGKTIYLRIPRAETQRFLGGLLWKILHNSARPDLKLEDIFDVAAYGAGQLPNLTPAFTGASALLSYLSGNNPYDTFRNRNIIPDTEFNAGFKYSLPIFLDWFVKNQGAGIVLPSYVSTNPTQLEKNLALPLISNLAGRWVKVSNYGQTETNKRIVQNQTGKAAEKTLNTRAKLDSAIQQYQSGPQSIMRKLAIERQLIKDVVGKGSTQADKTARTNLKKKFEVGIIYGSQGALTDSIITAQTNDAKAQLIYKAKEQLGGQYNSFIKDLVKKKVISNAVVSKVKKLK